MRTSMALPARTTTRCSSTAARIARRAILACGFVLSLAPGASAALPDCTPVPRGELFLGVLLSPGRLHPQHGTCWLPRLAVPGHDGTTLTANLFLPKRQSPEQRFPAVVMISSWAVSDRIEYLGQSHRLAKAGYVVLSYTPRGFFGSGGTVDVAGPLDIRDASAVIDWLLRETPAEPSAVALSGISYGSGIALLALAHDARIKTVTSLSTWGNLVDELYRAGTPNETWAQVLEAAGRLTGRLDPRVIEYTRALTHPPTPPAKLAEIAAWAQPRSPLHVVDKINARRAPVFLSKNFQDDLFTPNSTLALFTRLSGPRKLMLNQGIHAQAEVPGALFDVDNAVYDAAHRWLDRWLKGIDNGIDREPEVSMQLKFSRRRDAFATWPPPGLAERVLYLQPRGDADHGRLVVASPAEAARHAAADTFDNAFDTAATSGAVPILSTLGESLGRPVTTWLPAVARAHGVRYEGDPLAAPLALRGIAVLHLRLQPLQPQAQVVAYLYEVDDFGLATLVTHGVRTVHDATPGTTIDFPIEFAATARDVPGGHRLVVVVDTRDSLYTHPTSKRLVQRLAFEPGRPMTLTLPVR